jgi:fibronectin type 3 domain-containing protein
LIRENRPVRERKSVLGISLLLFVGLCLAPWPAGWAQPLSESANSAASRFADNRLIVKLKPEASGRVILGKVRGQVTTGLTALDSLNLKFRITNQKKLFRGALEAAGAPQNLSGVYILDVPVGTDLEQMKAEYQRRPEVDYAEPDYRLTLYDEPNDPLFVHQWSLNNLGAAQNGGQGYFGNDRSHGHELVMKFGTQDADIDALEAFQRNDPATVPLVGIVDTGVDRYHEDLEGEIWINPGEIPDNGIDDDHNGYVDDVWGWDFSGDSTEICEDHDPADTHGHGTHCAGIVAAVRDNGTGISGIVSPCRIMAIKIFPNAYSSVGAQGIVYAADMGCDVINMSWGSAFPSKVLQDALDYAASRSVLPVAAAGNDSSQTLNYPAAYDGVLTVGASDSKDRVTPFSSYGEHVEVVAPGEDILSLRAAGTDMYAENGFPGVHIVNQKYYLADGTSMAAPCVTGVAAYLLAVSPGMTAARTAEIIEQSADDLLYPYGGDSLYSPGKDIYSGYGRVNLASALQLVSGRMAKIDYPIENGQVSGEVAVIGTAGGPGFSGYVLEYGEGPQPSSWTNIASSSVPVKGDTLGLWDISGLSGLFTLRLTVGDQNQACVRVIANDHSYVKITSPAAGDTIAGFAEIRGYTLAPDFSGYRLEYGYGQSPQSWIEITHSSRMVADGVLGRWLVSFMDVTDYALRLWVETSGGQVYADTVLVAVKSIAIGGWSQELSSNGSLSPAAGDVNGDGYDEVVIGVGSSSSGTGTGGVEVFGPDGRREPGWPKDVSRNMMSSPALGDLDGDGIQDIVICSDLGVHAYRSAAAGWFAPCATAGNEFWSLATPVIADLEGDGLPEVLTISSDGQVYAWRNNGLPVVPGSQGALVSTVGSAGDMDFPCLTVADLDGDGQNEIIAAAAHAVSGEYGDYQGVGGIYIWDNSGNLLLGPGDYSFQFAYIFGIAVANVDRSPDLEVLVWGANGNHHALCAFKKDGTQAAGYPILMPDLITGWWFGNHPAVGDIDGDGAPEIVASLWTLGEARIYVWHADGTPLVPGGILVSRKAPDSERIRAAASALGGNIGEIVSRCRGLNNEELSARGLLVNGSAFATGGETFGSPVLADVDGDGRADVVVRTGQFLGTGYEGIYAWDHQGILLPGFPLYATAEPNLYTYDPYTPLVGDLDKDGKIDLVLATDYNIYAKPKLISWELDVDCRSDSEPWPKYMHDNWNSGRWGFSPPATQTHNYPPADFHVIGWSDSSVTLGWSPRAPSVTSGYNIYRSMVSGQAGERINVYLIPQPDSQWLDFGLIPRQRYYYTIASVDSQLVESGRSPEISITPGEPIAPARPSTATEGVQVTLTWAASPAGQGVDHYLIYHKPPSFGEYYLMASSGSETTFVDSSMKEIGTHNYRVSVVDSAGLESPSSEEALAEIVAFGLPPNGLLVSDWMGTTVTLSWKVTDGGRGCWVFRSTIPGAYGDLPLNAQPLDDPAGQDIIYQDLGLSEGVTYYYVVTQGPRGRGTSPSNRVDFLAGRPRPVAKVSGEVRDCHVVVHWNPSSEGDVVAYNIYDGIGHSGSVPFVAWVEQDTIWVDPSAQDSLKHYFWVTAVDSLGLEGILPPHLPTEPARVTGPLYPPEPPSEFKIIDHTDSSLTFKVSGQEAHSYNIYRGTSSGVYQNPPVNSTPLPDVFPQEYTLVCADLIEGQTYFFNATCVREDECGVSESGMAPGNEKAFVPGRPERVNGLVGELGDGCQIVLSWTPGMEGDLAEYKIYRSKYLGGRWTDYEAIDSVHAPDTVYVDTSFSVLTPYSYAITAVDTIGLESSLGEKVILYIEPPEMPQQLKVTEVTDTSVTLAWQHSAGEEGVAGANLYRSPVSGNYQGRSPINDHLVEYDSAGWARYVDRDVEQRLTYYYTATSVNVCGMESERYLCSQPDCQPLEDTAVVGRPHRPGLSVNIGPASITLHMSSPDADIRGYKIYRRQPDYQPQLLEKLWQDTVYVDSRVVAGRDYLYSVLAVDLSGLESISSGEQEACLMDLQPGILLVDLTRGAQPADGVNRDSVSSFYSRAMQANTYDLIQRGTESPLRLLDLSSHRVTVVHYEDEAPGFSDYYGILRQYLDAGGALLIEGRRILSSCESRCSEESLVFEPGDFRRDHLHMDSAWMPAYWSGENASPEFVGASCALQASDYPQTAKLDTSRVNHGFDPAFPDPDGGLPGVGCFTPLDPSEVIYTFNAAHDTSACNGKAVALRHFTRDFGVIYLGFPLYFVEEETAAQILRAALQDLVEFANRPGRAGFAADGLAGASVYPNPFKPHLGHTHVTFDGLTAQAKIEVFTLLGERVCTIRETDGDGQVTWDVTNDQGRKLASGVYIYRVSNDQGEEKISKLAVIR